MDNRIWPFSEKEIQVLRDFLANKKYVNLRVEGDLLIIEADHMRIEMKASDIKSANPPLALAPEGGTDED